MQGNLELQRQNILTQLAELVEIQEQRILNDEEVHLRVVLSVEFEENAKHEKVAWRQRSRAQEGDSNTKFFYKTANAHNRYNYIEQIAAEGVTLKDPADIKRR